ncbi:MAG: exonuclease domain-containing protein [Actinoallomurus sp.]
MSSWHLGRMCPFDLETTGVNVETARIVEAYIGQVGGDALPIDPPPTLINPGVEVPAEAAKIHGFTTAYLHEHGSPPAESIDQLVARAASALSAGVPLVGHNIRYDLTVLDRECRRHNLPTLAERTRGIEGPVIDTQVLSKHVDPYRRRVSETQGAQCLKTCCQAFRVGWDDEEAHGARYDALAAARVAWRIGVIAAMPREERPTFSASRDLFDDVAVDLPDLFVAQKRWAAEQDAGLAEYFRKQARRATDVDEQIELARRADSVGAGHWPLTPHAAQAVSA